MEKLLVGKVVIITGAGSGVGRAACRLFAREGATVVAADIDPVTAQETADLVAGDGGTALAVTCDIAREGAVQALVDTTVAHFGTLDILYNNAGITVQPSQSRRFADVDAIDVERLNAVNINGVIFGCKAAIRRFEAEGKAGVIVNTASVAGLIGYGNAVYGATKGAITSLTRVLALECAPKGIRVNSVCPAGMPTNFIEKGLGSTDAARASMASVHPLGKPIEPEDCANAALFLASDLASNITGVNLAIDGGLSAGIPTRR